MTTIGILGPDSRARDIAALSEWADVVWGVDSPNDVSARVSESPIDVLIVEASVAYLTEGILSLAPAPIARICAIAESDGVFAWADSINGVSAVRTVAEIRDAVTPTVKSVSPLEPTAPPSPETSAGSTSATNGRIVAVWGPVGAPGITTTAISVAIVCAQAGLSVLLCDVDSRGASVAIALGIVDETPGFAAACRLAGRDELTESEISRVTATVNRDGIRFDVLTGLPRATRWAEVSPAKIRGVFGVVRPMYDLVICDVGFGVEENEWVDDAPQRDGSTREILRTADSVVAVGSADAVGVARIIRGLDDVRDLCPAPTVILNRASPTSASEAREAIHRFTEHRVAMAVAPDSRGGVEEAFSRARAHPGPWREIVQALGVSIAQPRGRFRRR